jgi:hypothetical protein
MFNTTVNPDVYRTGEIEGFMRCFTALTEQVGVPGRSVEALRAFGDLGRDEFELRP